MSVRFNVAEVVGVVEKTLSSIDIRTASVLIDNKWQNVMSLCEQADHVRDSRRGMRRSK